MAEFFLGLAMVMILVDLQCDRSEIDCLFPACFYSARLLGRKDTGSLSAIADIF